MPLGSAFYFKVIPTANRGTVYPWTYRRAASLRWLQVGVSAWVVAGDGGSGILSRR